MARIGTFQRRFDGVEGEKSAGDDGPRALQRDLDELGKFFDPEAEHDDGSPGGIQPEHLGSGIAIPGDGTLPERIPSKPIPGLYEPPGTLAGTIWTQIKGLFSLMTGHSAAKATQGIHGLRVSDGTGVAHYLADDGTWKLLFVPSGSVGGYPLRDDLLEQFPGVAALDAHQGQALAALVNSAIDSTRAIRKDIAFSAAQLAGDEFTVTGFHVGGFVYAAECDIQSTSVYSVTDQEHRQVYASNITGAFSYNSWTLSSDHNEDGLLPIVFNGNGEVLVTGNGTYQLTAPYLDSEIGQNDLILLLPPEGYSDAYAKQFKAAGLEGFGQSDGRFHVRATGDLPPTNIIRATMYILKA